MAWIFLHILTHPMKKPIDHNLVFILASTCWACSPCVPWSVYDQSGHFWSVPGQYPPQGYTSLWSVSTTRMPKPMVSIHHKDTHLYGQYPPQGYPSVWSVSITRILKRSTINFSKQWCSSNSMERGSQHILLESYRIATWELLFL